MLFRAQVMDEAGRTNRTIAAGHKDAAVGRWVKTHGAFLERCTCHADSPGAWGPKPTPRAPQFVQLIFTCAPPDALVDGPAIHASRTSVT